MSSISIIEGPEGPAAIAASLYNGTISLFSPELKKLGAFQTDQDPLKTCAFLPGEV